MDAPEPQLIERKLSTTLSGRLDDSAFAELVLALTQGADHYLATVIWSGRRRQPTRPVLVCDASQPLATRHSDGSAGLILDDPYRIRSLRLMVFFRDGSILEANLGAGDTVLVTRGDANSEAAGRLSAGKQAVDDHSPAWKNVTAMMVGGLVATYLSVVPWTALWILAGLAMAVAVFVWGLSGIGHPIRPQDRRIRRTWRSLDWSKADIRTLVISVVVAALFFAIGFLL